MKGRCDGMADRVERSKKNIIWSFAGRIVNILLPFVTQTCLIYILGVQYVGLNGLFTSVLTILSLTELGIGSALVFSMYRPIAERDDAKVCALLAFYRKCYHIIGCVILTVGLILLPFIRHLISGDVPDDVNVYILYVIYLLNTVLSYFLFAYKTSLLNACQMVDVISGVDILTNITKCALQFVGLLLIPSYYMFVWVIPLTTVMRNIGVEIWTRRKYPNYFCQGKLLPVDVHEIFENVKGLFLQSIGNVVLTSVDNIVISIFLGLTVLGQYNVYLYIHTALVGLVGVISSSIIPVAGNSVAVEDNEKNFQNFRQFTLLWMCVVAWCAICELCLIQPFILLWAGDKMLLNNGIAVLFALYFYSNKIGDMVWVYKSASGIWKEGRYVPIISAAVNLSTNLLMIRWIGLTGVLISTILSLFFITIPFGSRVLFRVYFDYEHAWREYLVTHIKHIFLTAVIGLSLYWICMKIPLDGILCLAVRGVLCLIVPIPILWLVYRRDERMKGTGRLVRRLLHK